MIILYTLFLSLASAAGAADGLPPALSTSTIVPTIITLAPGLSDYDRFADGGPDANWYVGFNNAWIVQLPPAPVGDFSRAFLGAKLGRAKTRPVPGKPWQRERIPGKVYIGVSQTPAWGSEQSFFLAETRDIPSEPDPEAVVEGVGGGEWFWAEVPLPQISFTAPNYVVVWSPTNGFVGASTAPILGAAGLEERTSEPRAWLNRSITGAAPRTPGASLETPLMTLAPAIAIKLVPPGPDEPAVSVADLTLARAGKRVLARFSAAGEDVAEGWIEWSRDQLEWERVSRVLRRPPYSFALPSERSFPPGSYLRGAAKDISGAIGYSDAAMIPYAPR